MSVNNPVGLDVDNLTPILNKISTNCGEFFNNLIKRSKVNLQENKQLNAEYLQCLGKLNELNKSLKRADWLKTTLLVLICIPLIFCCGIGLFILLAYFVKKKKEKNKISKLNLAEAANETTSEKKKEIYLQMVEVNKQKDEIVNKLEKCISPFFEIYSTNEIIQKFIVSAFDGCSFKNNVDPKDFSIWNSLPSSFDIGKYESFCRTTSTNLYGHPCLMYETRNQLWGTAIYVGTDEISYTNSEGETEWETVEAEVPYPRPYYCQNAMFAIKTNFNPQLSFNNVIIRQKNRSFFGKKMKDTRGGPPMDNPDFDNKYLFYRNNENSFRALFTILTQERYLKLTEQVGQFRIWKKGQFTICSDENYLLNATEIKEDKIVSADPDFEEEVAPVLEWDCFSRNSKDSFDLEEFAKQKTEQIKSFITSYSYIRMPIINLPVYMNEKYVEKTRPDITKAFVGQSEAIANIILEKIPEINNHEVPFIAKCNQTRYLSKNGLNIYISTVKVTSFETSIIIIPKMAHGAHGSTMVDVPVTKYDPISKTYYLLEIHGLNPNKDSHDIRNNWYYLNNGVYGRLSKSPITQDNIDLALEFLKPFMNINNKNHPYSVLKKLERKL